MNPFSDLIPQNKNQAPGASPSQPTAQPANLSGNPFADLTPAGRSASKPTAAPAPEKKGFMNSVKEIGKSIVTAPATIAARPFQAVQAGAQFINDKPALDAGIKDMDALRLEGDVLLRDYKAAKAAGQDTTELKKRIQDLSRRTIGAGEAIAPIADKRAFSGGVIAPTPENAKDVVKDVGRGIQTVALGTAAPIAGGAAFGLGSSLEQGDDLFSVQTLVNTALGAAGGKVLDWVGKPLFNGAGKVIGTITPKVLKDVAEKGAGALQKFAADNKLFGGAASKLSETIAKGFQGVDDKAASLFKGTGSGIKDAISSQYPGLSKTNLQNRYTRIEAENFAKPTTIPSASYNSATDIFKNAKAQGNDLADIAVKNGIRHDTLIDGGKYATADTADLLRSEAMKTSHDLIRPALEAAEPGVERVPIQRIRQSMLDQIDAIKPSQITDAERAIMKQRIEKDFADNSAAALAHPEGYSLTDLHDNSIVSNLNGKHKPNGLSSDNFNARQSREQGEVFRKILEDVSPKELEIGKFKAELAKQFQLADYLTALDTKKVPQGIVSKAVDLFGKVAGAGAGAQIGGGIGGIAGYHMGGVLFNAFEHVPNPVKARYLASLQKEAPEVFKAFESYLGKQETQKLMRLKLPGAGQSSYRDPGKTLFSSPNGQVTDNLQEAVDVASRMNSAVKTPEIGKKGLASRVKLKEILESGTPYVPVNELPVIDIGKLPKTRKGAIDVEKLTAPQVKAVEELLNKIDQYVPADKLPVIDAGKVPKKKKTLNDTYSGLPSINF